MSNLDEVDIEYLYGYKPKPRKRVFKITQDGGVLGQLIFAYDPPEPLREYALVPSVHEDKVVEYKLIDMEE